VSDLSPDGVIEKLLQNARETERLSEDILEKRRQLYRLTVGNPGKVIEYFERQPLPTDPRERLLRDMLLKIAANAVLDSLRR
jgi:hypothetical protein